MWLNLRITKKNFQLAKWIYIRVWKYLSESKNIFNNANHILMTAKKIYNDQVNEENRIKSIKLRASSLKKQK